MKTRYTSFLFALFLISCPCGPSLKGQVDPAGFSIGNFLELADGDSLKVYLNCLGVITEARCAEFYRTGRMDPVYLSFKGKVRDYSMKGSLLMEAVYEGGLMNGPASYYHENGKLEAKGRYTEGVRTGVWQYYYDNGQLQKIINFVDQYPYVSSYYTRSGKARVMHGDGVYKGRFRLSRSCDRFQAKGPVKEGRMDGKWAFLEPGGTRVIAFEHYENGRFLYRESKGVIQSADQATIRIQGACPHEEVFLDVGHPACPGDQGIRFLRYKDEVLTAHFFPELIEDLDSLAPPSTPGQWVIIGLDVDEIGVLTEVKVRSSARDLHFEELIRSLISEKGFFAPYVLNGHRRASSYFFTLAFADGQTVIPFYVSQLMLMMNGL